MFKNVQMQSGREKAFKILPFIYSLISWHICIYIHTHICIMYIYNPFYNGIHVALYCCPSIPKSLFCESNHFQNYLLFLVVLLVFVCVCVHMWVCMHASIRAWSWCWVSSSFTTHLIFEAWSPIEHGVCWFGCLVTSRDPSAFTLPPSVCGFRFLLPSFLILYFQKVDLNSEF